AVCLVGGNLAGQVDANQNDDSIGEAGRASAITDSGHFDRPAVENVLITARSGALDPDAAKAAASDVATRMKALPDVAGAGDPVPAQDGAALLLPVTMTGSSDTASAGVQPLLDATAAAQKAHPGLGVEEAGGASINKAMDDTLGQDFKTAEFLSLPVT